MAADESNLERRRTPRKAAEQPGQPVDTVAEGVGQAFTDLYQAGAQHRIALIRQGVAAYEVGELSALLDVPKESLMASLGIARATLSRKVRENRALSPDESERVLGLQALIGQVQAMVGESGEGGGFDAAAWLSGWLNTPLPALGGVRPASYLDTVEGQKFIAHYLAMAQSGAYA